ncbi:MAG: hypothetical protein HFH82_16235 [Lachnospiraceae bacterium]|nr:hypothetical protein [Lachnospiraceae bacterium]
MSEIKLKEMYSKEDILEKLKAADRILVGLGEEFDKTKVIGNSSEYQNGKNLLKSKGCDWLIPAWDAFCLRKMEDKSISSALGKLSVLLEGKNAFIVSTSVNGDIARYGGNVVMPCGSGLKKQCFKGCGNVLLEVTEADRKIMGQGFEKLFHESEVSQEEIGELFSLGTCPECGAPLVLNTVYAENYNEGGYLEQWKIYTKWLQGTLNHQLLVLELGVGMKFPSVIRWPFEKAAFFNQKAFFCRVNETLYQLAEELSGKGCGISMNTIDWLNQL